MSDTNNGWPDKPGVPLNPGLPGAHWLKGYTEDAWMYDGAGGWWGPGYSHNLDAGTVATRYSYLGPCLTPDEAAALQARVTELEGLVRIVVKNDVLVLAKEDIVLPGSFTFKTISKLDAWRNKARAALEGRK